MMWIGISNSELSLTQLCLNGTQMHNISNGYAYIIRGRSSPVSLTNVGYIRYKILHATQKNKKVKWIRVQNTPNCEPGSVVSSNHPMVVGDFTSSDCQQTSDVSIYDPTTCKWSIVGQCVRPHAGSCAILQSVHHLSWL